MAGIATGLQLRSRWTLPSTVLCGLILSACLTIPVDASDTQDVQWASDFQVWAYHPDNVTTDSPISSVWAGARLTLRLSRQGQTDSSSAASNGSATLENIFDDRLRVISVSERCGESGSARSTQSLINFPSLEAIEVNASDDVLNRPAVNYTSTSDDNVSSTIYLWRDLAVIEVGRFRICHCTGNSGQCDTDAEFSSQVGEIRSVGPTSGQSFSCYAGWPCSLGEVSGDVIIGGRLRVMTRCWPPLQTHGFLPGTGAYVPSTNETVEEQEEEDLLNDPSVSLASTSNARFFSWGTDEVIGPGARYELCWCSGVVDGCNRTENFLVQVGSLKVPGPTEQIEILCSAGRSCHFALLFGFGVDLSNGDRIMALPDCRGGVNITVEGWPNNGITEAGTNHGHEFTFDPEWVNLTAMATGTKRACWCPLSKACINSDDFRLDIGTITLVGPVGGQSWFCSMGQSCTIGGISGTTLAVDDYYVPMTQCATQGNVSGFQDGQLIPSSVQPSPSYNSSIADFRLAMVLAAVGSYELCWAPSWQPPSAQGCSDLQWDSSSHGSSLTCAQTQVTIGTCAHTTYEEAKTTCYSLGARLCLPHEIFQGEAIATECAVDSDWVWTSQSCGPGWHTAAQLSTRTRKCVQATVEVTAWSRYDNTLAWACCADSEGIGFDTFESWFGNPMNYISSAGKVKVRGPLLQDAYCATKDECVILIKGMWLNQGTNRLQIIQASESCGSDTAAAASQDFAISRANTTSQMVDLEEFSLGESTTFGFFKMCWCSVGQTLCNQNSHFNVDAGTLLVGGINEQTISCIFAVPCVVPLNGTNLGGADSILIIPSNVLCSDATTASLQQIEVTNNPATTSDVADTSVKTFDLGGIFQQGSTRMCYCINFGNRLCVEGSAPILDRFSLAAGLITVYGAFFNVTLPNGRVGVPYSLALSGSQLGISNRITVQRVESGIACGSLGSNVSDVALSIPTTAPTNVNSQATEESWFGAVIARAGNFRVCWCPGGAACNAPNGFSLQAAWLVINGIEESFSYPAQIVGNPFELRLHGRELRPSDRVIIIPSNAAKCGESGALEYMGSQIQGVMDVSPTAKDIGDVIGAQEFWLDIVILAVGEYVVCWCGHTSCTLDVHFATEATQIVVTGPYVHEIPPITAGEFFDIALRGSGLGYADRISIVETSVECGTPQANILHSTVVVPAQPGATVDINATASFGDRTSAEALGPPAAVSVDGDIASQVWNGLQIRWKGAYKLCWAGNYSYSRRCAVMNEVGNCTSYENAYFPFHVGNLNVMYGNASIVGQTHVARCDSLDVMALAPTVLQGNSTQLSALSAFWDCTPPQGELCVTLESYLATHGTGQLHLHIPSSVLADALDRETWVATSQGSAGSVQNFMLTVSLVDMDNITRWSSLAVSISNLEPLVQGLPANGSTTIVTVADELRFAVYIKPPGGVICADDSNSALSAHVSWRLLTASNSSLNITARSMSANIHDAILSDSGIAALGLGMHTIAAHVDFYGSHSPQDVIFHVDIREAPVPQISLHAPSNAAASCPFVVSAQTSADGVYEPTTLSYSWSCNDCAMSLAASAGPLQVVQGGSLQAGQHSIELQVRAGNGANTTVAADVTVMDSAPWTFSHLPMPSVASSGKEAACEVISAGTNAPCTPPAGTSWYLQRIHTDGSTSESELSTQLLQFEIASQSALRVLAIIPQTLWEVGGAYRCILRAEGNTVHTSGITEVVSNPSGGRIVAAPSSGIALETRFTLSSVDWQTDQLPIMHAFLAAEHLGNSSTHVGNYIRGWDLDNVMGCVMGSSGTLQISVQVRDNLGGEAMAVASVQVQQAKQPITYDVEQLAQWPPDARSLTAAVSALLTATGAQFSGGSTSRSEAVEKLLDGLWSAAQLSSTGQVHQEDLGLQAWALEHSVLLGRPGLPSLQHSLVAAQTLDRSAALAGELEALPTEESLSSATASSLLSTASMVGSMLGAFSDKRQEVDAVLTLLRDFEGKLGEALLLKLRRTGSIFAGSDPRLDKASGGNMSISAGKMSRASALAGLQMPEYGLGVKISTVIGRRMTSGNFRLSCHPDEAELQITHWGHMSPLSAVPFSQLVLFEGDSLGLSATWPSTVGKREPYVATVRLWLCPEGLQHVDQISLNFDISGEPMQQGISQEIENGTLFQIYHINITWVCAQWDHSLGVWRVQASMVDSWNSSSITCVSRLPGGNSEIHLAALPAARTELYSQTSRSIVKADDDGLKFTTKNWLPLIIAALILQVPLVALCIWDAFDPPESSSKAAPSNSVSLKTKHREAPMPMLVLFPSMSIFEGLYQIHAFKLLSWRCSGRRRRKRSEALEDFRFTPNFVPSQQDAEAQLNTRPPLRPQVKEVAQEALVQLQSSWEQNQETQLAMHPTGFSRRCFFKQYLHISRQRKALMKCFAGYRSLLVGSENYRRAMKQFGIDINDHRKAEALVCLDVDICDGTGVGPEDEALVLRVAHHVQDFLEAVAEDPQGIRLSDGEELSVKCCQQALRQAFAKSPATSSHTHSGNLKPQPYFAPPGAARFILTSLELKEKTTKQQNQQMQKRSSPSSRKKRQARRVKPKQNVPLKSPDGSPSNNSDNSPVPVVPEPTAASPSSFLRSSTYSIRSSISQGAASIRSSRRSVNSSTSASEDEQSEAEPADDGSQVFLKDCHYYMWVQSKMLFIHRAETIVVDKLKVAQPLDFALSITEDTRVYHLHRDVADIAMCPNDDRHIVLTLCSGLCFTWRTDGEIRNWIESLREVVDELVVSLRVQPVNASVNVSDAQIRDALHCWQPHMQGERSSSFFYGVHSLPHLASNVHLEILTGSAIPAVMWYSHGGTTVSFALLRDEKKLPTGSLQIVIPGEVAERSSERSSLNSDESARKRSIFGDAKHHAVGLYISDISSVRSDHLVGHSSSTLRYCLEIKLVDGVKFRLCFNSRFMRMSFHQSLERLCSLVDPFSPEISIVSPSSSKRQNLQAMGIASSEAGFVTALGAQDAPPSRHGSRHGNRPSSWNGLCGAMEIKIFSASKLGLTDVKDKERTTPMSTAEAFKKSKQPMPLPRICASVATQAPPQRPEMRKTADLPEGRTANPIWNCIWFYTIEHTADDPVPPDIKLEVWNADGRNEYLGEVTVPFPLEDSMIQYSKDLKANPLKIDSGKEVNGTLSFQVAFKADSVSGPSKDLNETAKMFIQKARPSEFKSVCGTLGIEVIRAVGLRSADLLTSDPYCVVLVSSAPRQLSSWKTSTMFGTLNPVWREVHEFQMNWPVCELETAPEVKIEIWDFDSVSADEFLGEVSFKLPHGDGENFIDLEVQPNRSKSPNSVKGRIQARIYFKNQFTRDGSHGALDPYEKAFCQYFGNRVVDEQFARTMAPPLIFFHMGSRRLLFSQCRHAWRCATHDLLASKAARGPKSRAQAYLELMASLCFAIGVASGILLCIQYASDDEPSFFSSALAGYAAAFVAPNPATSLANFVWHRPAPPALVGRMGLGGTGWGVPKGLALFALIMSLLCIAAFLALANQECVEKLWVTTGVVLILRLLIFPWFRAIAMTWLLISVRTSRRFDWYLRLYPSIMTACGALLQRLPYRMLANSPV